MNEDPTSAFQPFPDEGIAGREMLDDVRIFNVVYIDDMMLEALEQSLIKRQGQDGEHVRDIVAID
ncbi:MAG: hypothetical protein Q9208_000779 [Pyrenodesmia sp. 3 TL-2023]